MRTVVYRVVAIDTDYEWTDHVTAFDAVAHLVSRWFS